MTTGSISIPRSCHGRPSRMERAAIAQGRKSVGNAQWVLWVVLGCVVSVGVVMSAVSVAVAVAMTLLSRLRWVLHCRFAVFLPKEVLSHNQSMNII